ncbi:MAG: hypothetical protein GY807_07025 [Gammaproteobacteria bacterium]|nr:hypothetical protein [Gammaproteobacteria bacterium]
MRTTFSSIRRGVILLPVLLLSSLPQYTIAQEVIVNPNLSSEGIRLNALRAIFSMRLRSWPDGTPVHVFVMEDEARVHVSFTKKKLDVFPHQLRYFWDRLVYSGTGQAPTTVDSEKEMLKMVAATPGAIGYLTEGMIDDTVHVLGLE